MKKLFADIAHPVGTLSWITEALQILEEVFGDIAAAKVATPAPTPTPVDDGAKKALADIGKRVAALESAAKVDAKSTPEPATPPAAPKT